MASPDSDSAYGLAPLTEADLSYCTRSGKLLKMKDISSQSGSSALCGLEYSFLENPSYLVPLKTSDELAVRRRVACDSRLGLSPCCESFSFV